VPQHAIGEYEDVQADRGAAGRFVVANKIFGMQRAQDVGGDAAMEARSRVTSIACNGRSEACNVRSTLAAAPTGLPGLPRPGSPPPARRGIALVRSISRPFAWRARAIEPASGTPSILSPYQTR
jgi:hypothetical protein